MDDDLGLDPRRHERRAPVCPACGGTTLPQEVPGPGGGFRCENPDCEQFDEPIR